MSTSDERADREYVEYHADKLRDKIAELEAENQDLVRALDELVRLYGHYATLLNMHDGGERKPFTSGAEFLARYRAGRG